MEFPVEFTARIRKQEGIDTANLLRSLSEPSPVSIRTNPFKWTKEPAAGKGVPWCREGWYLETRPSYTFDPLFHAGCYYPQEASGMFAGEAFRQIGVKGSDIRVLDLCAAPGGKSTHLSALIGDSGVLISNEVIRSRAAVLAENMTRWGAANIMVTNNDPIAFSDIEEYFDIILADVPCSGEGMFRDVVAVKEWSSGNAHLCSERQQRIIRDIWPSLRKGGYLIYCTCTFNPAENEENISWIIENLKGESVKLATSQLAGIHTIYYKGITGYAFYPYKTAGEGFFLSVVRKTGERTGKKTVRKRKVPDPPDKKQMEVVRGIVNKNVPLVVGDSDNLVAVPLREEEYQILNQRLKIIKKGISAGSLKKDGLVPSHELVLSEILAPGAFPDSELEYPDAIKFLRKENFRPGLLPNGWITVSYNGVKIGLIKNIGQRVNNYLPVSWRIRMTGNGDPGKVISWRD